MALLPTGNGLCTQRLLWMFHVAKEVSGGVRQYSSIVLLFKVAAPAHHSLLA
jgi:hypothetical protein